MHSFEYVKESRSEAKQIKKQENPHKRMREEIIPDGLTHEVPVGKGLSGGLNVLRDQGSLKEINECSDRKRGSKTSKLGGVYDDQGQREIIIERRVEFGRIMNNREAFRQFCYKFHGRRPSRTKQEMRIRKIEREMKAKQSSNDHEQAVAKSLPGGSIIKMQLQKRALKLEVLRRHRILQCFELGEYLTFKLHSVYDETNRAVLEDREVAKRISMTTSTQPT